MKRKPTGAEIRESVRRWQHWYGLDNWTLTVKIGPIAGGCRGTCEADWSYHEAELRFDPTAMARHGDDVEEIVGHEVGHVMLWRGHEEAQRRARNGIDEEKLCALEENEVTIMSRAFLRLAREAKLIP